MQSTQTSAQTRKAAKAGTWYDGNPQSLNNELTNYLNQANKTLPQNTSKTLKAVIGPHAGLAYSGPPAAWGYKNIDP